MILADTSVWVDHLRNRDQALATLLLDRQIAVHPFVIGEIALGQLKGRGQVLATLAQLPRTTVALDDETMLLIEREKLFGTGIGYIDAHLLASTRLTPSCRLWTRDRRLADAARMLALAASLS